MVSDYRIILEQFHTNTNKPEGFENTTGSFSELVKDSSCSFWVFSTSTWRLVFSTSVQFCLSSTLKGKGGSTKGRRLYSFTPHLGRSISSILPLSPFTVSNGNLEKVSMKIGKRSM